MAPRNCVKGTPAELRERADEIERLQNEAKIEARCRSHGLNWDRNGRCYEDFCEFVPCRGHYGRPHYESYEDDYGSRQFCPGCNGSGKNFVTHKHRRPEWDAPRPKGAPG